MGRPRRYVTDAERQAAYRRRKLGDVPVEDVDAALAARAAEPAGCTAYTPHGTRCKLCGKLH